MSWIFALTLFATPSSAKSLYEFQRGAEHYTLDRETARLDLAAAGMTYVIPIDACTKSDVETFLTTIADNYRRLLKSDGASDAKRFGTVMASGETRALRELATHEAAPEFFIGLPSRFVNLMVTLHRSCPRSFEK